MSNFLAIDFETANRNRNSACALGLVKVIDNQIVNYESYLIKPPNSYFEFTYIHGISYHEVKNAPTFKELWSQINHHFDDIDLVVAHNASFDRSVLENCCNYYNISKPQISFNCTMILSRKLWNIRPTKLSDVCGYFNIPLNHHQADSDAMACAKIMLLALNHNNSSFSLNDLETPQLADNFS